MTVADALLVTRLSRLLVAFTIEFDNEWEKLFNTAGRMPVVLVSKTLWSNFMRFVDEGGTTVREIEERAHLTKRVMQISVAGLERWGYVLVERQPGEKPTTPRPHWALRATPAGRHAQETWRPLEVEIERRWAERFGKDDVEALRDALAAVVAKIGIDLPQYLPIVPYGTGMRAEVVHAEASDAEAAAAPLSVLLAQVLLAFTLDFERGSDVSLAVGGNLLPVLDEDGVAVRDLPRLTGVSKQAISVAVGNLEKTGRASVAPNRAATRTKIARLTPAGVDTRRAFSRQMEATEKAWVARHGSDTIRRLARAIDAISEPRDGDGPRLGLGLQPAPSCWRATKPYLAQTQAMLLDPLTALPRYPVVSHRGGWPDGS